MIRRYALLTAAALALGAPAGASAAFPGANGKLVYGVATYDKALTGNSFIGPGALSTMDAGTRSVTELPDDAAYNDFEPAWSPDGTRIAFATTAGGRYDGIYVTDAASWNPKRVAKSRQPDTPAWSPDGRTLLYTDWKRGVLAVPADASASPRLIIANPKRGQAIAPTVTPDGSTIVFVRQLNTASNTKYRSEIWAAAADGTSPRRLVASTADHRFPHLPDVSPDGARIAFEALGPGGHFSIWTAAIDGASPKVLTSTSGSSSLSAAAWSPDGSQLAVTKFKPSIKQGGSLLLIDAATGATRTLLQAKKRYFLNPSWQPLPPQAAGARTLHG